MILVAFLLLGLSLSLLIVLWKRRKRNRIIPLEEPLVSPYSKKRCVFYRVEAYRVMEDGSVQLIFEKEKSINFIVVDRNGLPVNVKLRPKKVYEKFIQSNKLSPDPFAYLGKERPLILDDTVGIIIREWVI